jgi:hypothetical protein
MGLQLSDAIVIVVVIVLLYYVLMKESFDLKTDQLPAFFPSWWTKVGMPVKKAWVTSWTSKMTPGQRNAYNNRARAYMIQWAKGNISRANNIGPYVRASRAEFTLIYNLPASKK